MGLCPHGALSSTTAALGGDWLHPGDPGFEDARKVASVNPRTNKRPASIARCRTAGDVEHALSTAREQQLAIAVRSGGHDVLGASVCDGGLLIDLGAMKDIVLDPARQTVSVGAGVLARELCAACDPYGLLPIVGVHPDVGVAGLTLGGGFGLFLGRHGASCDNLLAAELVTADGQHRRVCRESDPDLFWALRGGGGNFGIVTSLEFKVHPAGPLLGGMLAFRSGLASFLTFYEEAMQHAPDELTVEVVVFGLGKPVVVAIVCWSGDLAEGERVLAPWRAQPGCWVDAIEPVTHAQLRERVGLDYLMKRVGLGGLMRAASRNTAQPEHNHWLGGSMQGLTPDAVAMFSEAAARARDTWTIGLSHRLHGQACRARPDESPLPRPHGQLSYLFGGNWRDPVKGEATMRWVDQSMQAARPLSTQGTYVNFLSSDDEPAVRASYGDSYERLAELKHRYDPTNLFRGNRNIRPAAPRAAVNAAPTE
jgi:FAD/FMN-containing dehydrogenase